MYFICHSSILNPSPSILSFIHSFLPFLSFLSFFSFLSFLLYSSLIQNMSAVKGLVTVLVALVVLPFISVADHPALAIGKNTSSLAPYRNEASLALTLTAGSWN